MLQKIQKMERNLHRSSRHLTQAPCASAGLLESSVHYLELPSSEPTVIGQINANIATRDILHAFNTSTGVHYWGAT